jgi:hypothetical protein
MLREVWEVKSRIEIRRLWNTRDGDLRACLETITPRETRDDHLAGSEAGYSPQPGTRGPDELEPYQSVIA